MWSDCGETKIVTSTGNCLSWCCLRHTRKAVAYNKIMHSATEHINFREVSIMLPNFMRPFLSPDASYSFEVDIYVHHSPKEIPSSTVLFNIRYAHSALVYCWLHEQFEVRKYTAFVPLCNTLWITILGTRSCKLRRAVAYLELRRHGSLILLWRSRLARCLALVYTILVLQWLNQRWMA